MKLTATHLDEVRISNIARSADWIAAEYNTESSPSTFYSVGSATTSQPTTSNVTYFAHTDHLGSTRVLTDVNGSGYDNYDYLPFGETRSGGWGTTHKFTGDERDSETGLDHTLFRQYSSSLGRWSSPDPLAGDISDPQSLNRYSYVGNNPLAYVDPLGADEMSIGYCDGTDFDQDPFTGQKCVAPITTMGDLCERGNTCGGGGGGFSISVNFGGLFGGTGPFGETNGLPPGVSVPPITLRSLVFGSSQCDFGPCFSNAWGDEKGQDDNGNSCTRSVFSPSCKVPSCIAVFANAGSRALDWPVLPDGAKPEDLIKAGFTVAAAEHIIERGLVVPLRSSIVRNLLALGESAAVAVAALPIIYQEAVGLKAEYRAWKSGTCRTIWSSTN